MVGRKTRRRPSQRFSMRFLRAGFELFRGVVTLVRVRRIPNLGILTR
jgi:hypothetical protein